MIDYTKLTEDEFQEHCSALYGEQDRRSKLRDIPSDVQKLAKDFEALGGDRADLITKINEEEAE
jgi:hypothetical protein